MSLYAIGDLHLSFSTDKPMDVFGREWKNHVRKLEKNWKKVIRAEDTVVITGDHSWGRNLTESKKDLEFIDGLPGRKILLRGNHDMFWNVKKTEQLNRLYEGKMTFLQNNHASYSDYALVGTKGYCYEGKIPGNILRRFVTGSCKGFVFRLNPRLRTDLRNFSCSYIIRRPVSVRWRAVLRR